MGYRNYYRSTLNFGIADGLTPGVKKLLIANIAVFVLEYLLPAIGLDRLIPMATLVPYAVTHLFWIWQLVTYMFLHQGIFHILFNMFALGMFGSDLERNWGTRRFLFYYFLCGIGAGLTVVLFSPSSLTGTMGASGAIYGILLAFGMLFPDRLIFMYFLIPIRAKYFVMIMGGIELLSELSLPGGPISHLAHLGGMGAGLLFLRGRPYYFDLRNHYYRWQRARLQRAFRVYVSKHEGEEPRPETKEPRRGPWVN